MVTGGIVITGRVVVVVVGASVGATAACGGTVASVVVTIGGRVTGVVTGARLIVGGGGGGGGASVVRTGGGGGGAGVVEGAGGGAVVTGAGSVGRVTTRGVVSSAICQVGVGGTNTWNVAGSALYGPAACRPSDDSGGGTTVGPRLPNAPPAAPIISPETAETVAIASAPIATVLSSMLYPSSACKCVHHRGRCPRLVHVSAIELPGRGSLEGCRAAAGVRRTLTRTLARTGSRADDRAVSIPLRPGVTMSLLDRLFRRRPLSERAGAAVAASAMLFAS